MDNGNGFVQRAPLPPLNSPTITEADRARVYGVIGQELNNILNGPTSYHSDSVKKSSRNLMSELKNFIGAVDSLKETVNDPANIVGDAVRNLNRFKEAFEAATSNDIETMWNNPADERDQRIKLPDSFAPTTEDHNVIYVDPESAGQFSAPNPLSPNQWRRDMKASTAPSNDVAASAASPDIYPRLVSRVVSSRSWKHQHLEYEAASVWSAERATARNFQRQANATLDHSAAARRAANQFCSVRQ